MVATDADASFAPLYAETEVAPSTGPLPTVVGATRLSVRATVRNTAAHVGGDVAVVAAGCALFLAADSAGLPSGTLIVVPSAGVAAGPAVAHAQRLAPNATLDAFFDVASSRAMLRDDALECTLKFTQRGGHPTGEWTGRWPLADVLYDDNADVDMDDDMRGNRSSSSSSDVDVDVDSGVGVGASGRACTADEAAVELSGGRGVACLAADCAAKYGDEAATFDPRIHACVVPAGNGTLVRASASGYAVQCGEHGSWDGGACVCDEGWATDPSAGQTALMVWVAPHCGALREPDAAGAPTTPPHANATGGRVATPSPYSPSPPPHDDDDDGDDDDAVLAELQAQRDQVWTGVVIVLAVLVLGGIAIFSFRLMADGASAKTDAEEAKETKAVAKRGRAKERARRRRAGWELTPRCNDAEEVTRVTLASFTPLHVLETPATSAGGAPRARAEPGAEPGTVERPYPRLSDSPPPIEICVHALDAMD